MDKGAVYFLYSRFNLVDFSFPQQNNVWLDSAFGDKCQRNTVDAISRVFWREAFALELMT
jgi:hypothetical protein